MVDWDATLPVTVREETALMNFRQILWYFPVDICRFVRAQIHEFVYRLSNS